MATKPKNLRHKFKRLGFAKQSLGLIVVGLYMESSNIHTTQHQGVYVNID